MLTKNCPIEEFAIEPRRRNSQDAIDASGAAGTLSERQLIDKNNLLAEELAKERELWMDFGDIFSLGGPAPRGVENDVYLNTNGNVVYKVNNLMTSKSVLSFLERIILHNTFSHRLDTSWLASQVLDEEASIQYCEKIMFLMLFMLHQLKLLSI